MAVVMPTEEYLVNKIAHLLREGMRDQAQQVMLLAINGAYRKGYKDCANRMGMSLGLYRAPDNPEIPHDAVD